jgi:AmiR/NasT family two-component response regulator
VAASGSNRALRVVLADEHRQKMDRVREALERLGHELIAAETAIERAARIAAAREADVAVVAVHADARHALELVERLNDVGPCPVVLLLDEDDSELVAAAADRGLDAFTSGESSEGLQAAIELALRRDHQAWALAQRGRPNPVVRRRQTIDRATGVVMERFDLDAEAAYERLRAESRRTRTALILLADGVLRSRRLLPGHLKRS